MHSAGVAIIGLGSPHGDDRVGHLVAKQLLENLNNDSNVYLITQPIDLVELLRLYRRCFLIDACSTGAVHGTIVRIEWPCDSLTSRFSGTSSHGFSVADALSLAEQLDFTSCDVTIYGVEMDEVAPSAPLSSEVLASVPEVVARIMNEIAAFETASDTSETGPSTATILGDVLETN